MPGGLKFDWDAANLAHIVRHEVEPFEAEEALLNDPFDVRYEFREGEERWTSIGHTHDLRVLLVVWTIRGEDLVRVITARQASKEARLAYFREKGLGT